jgi:hypothetical protein
VIPDLPPLHLSTDGAHKTSKQCHKGLADSAAPGLPPTPIQRGSFSDQYHRRADTMFCAGQHLTDLPNQLSLMLRQVRFGSNTDVPRMSAARLLHPAQRTSAGVSLNVCVGPEAEVMTLAKLRLIFIRRAVIRRHARSVRQGPEAETAIASRDEDPLCADAELPEVSLQTFRSKIATAKVFVQQARRRSNRVGPLPCPLSSTGK